MKARNRPNFVSFCLDHERDLSLCTNIAVSYLDAVTVHVGNEVLVEAEKSELIVSYPEEILDLLLRPILIHYYSIIYLLIYIVSLNYTLIN
jgi:hypothetical protein